MISKLAKSTEHFFAILMKKERFMIPLIIADIILIPSIMFQLSPQEFDFIFQVSFFKYLLIIGEFILTVIFTFCKPSFWIIVFVMYYLICLIYAIKTKLTKKSIVFLTILCLINIYGNISAYELMDALASI